MFYKWKDLLFQLSLIFPILPVEQLSMHKTVSPLFNNLLIKFIPKKPNPPVTKFLKDSGTTL